MIAVIAHAEGAVLPVRANPGARSSEIVGEYDGSLRVSVTAPPDRGRANEALIETLARGLNLRSSQFELIAGNTTRNKLFLVRGVSPADLLKRIQDVLEPTVLDTDGPPAGS